jgi:hypothetical protein
MPRTIAINGTRLDRVQMPLEPERKEVVSFLHYPTRESH